MDNNKPAARQVAATILVRFEFINSNLQGHGQRKPLKIWCSHAVLLRECRKIPERNIRVVYPFVLTLSVLHVNQANCQTVIGC